MSNEVTQEFREGLAEKCLHGAIERAKQNQNRNDVGLRLARQIRSRGLSQAEAEPFMLEYAARVAVLDPDQEPYTKEEAMTALEEAFTPQLQSCAERNELPRIVVSDTHLRDITTEALKALYKANKPEYIFWRGGVLTRVNRDENGKAYTEALGDSAFKGCLARACNFMRADKKGEGYPVAPPIEVVRDCLALGHWKFSPLVGITESPVMRPDGTVVTAPGYDGMTNLYYHPSPKLIVPSIAEAPGKADITAATELVLEPLADLPFDSEASRAHAVAMEFTPILRPMIDGPVPLGVVDKPQPGTGAGLFAEIISQIATGGAAAMMATQKDDEGWRKAITSILLKGQLLATIDNVENDLWAPSLAAVLTATTWQDRILGRSEMVTLPVRTVWMATGNNIRLRGDLPRRSIWVRLDAKMARPWLRDSSRFQHPRLIEWVAQKRGAILAAILTIARAWVVEGKPEAPGLPCLGGYESYCRVIGGILNYIGIKGFLGNLATMYDEMDAETPQWEGFLEAWHEVIGDAPVTASALMSRINENAELRAALPDTLADTQAKNYTVILGQKLSKKNGVRYPNGLGLRKVGEVRRAATWKVIRFENETSHQNSFKCEVGEVQDTPSSREKNNNYRGGVTETSQELTLASKEGEVVGDLLTVDAIPLE